MANAFAFGVAVEAGEPSKVGLTVIERNDETDDPFVVRRTTVSSGDAIDAVAKEVQDRLAEDPYTARSSVIVHVGNEPGEALADALSDRGVRPVRVRTRDTDAGAAAESEGEAVIDARNQLAALSNAHRTGGLRVEHRTTEDAAHLARMLGHLVDDSNEGEAIDTDAVDVQGMSTLLAYWWSTEQTNDPTERLRANLPGTEAPSPTA